ncbi:uncharacterized protein TrAFT101_006367 [Trichoderma asperellum]|uniref:uncharacterized protein n=1 Tax=Trichoderma asperellum TaxID=101201 RepID=UPI00331EBAE3|nr:hypothetical protein TrAFT101_006367 [Trichoderma asperellum]
MEPPSSATSESRLPGSSQLHTLLKGGALGLAVSKARNWTGQCSDDSNLFDTIDDAISAEITATYTVVISNITLDISYAPTWSDRRNHGGYFYSSDEMLHEIWYANTYTLQTNTIAATTGREFPVQTAEWKNDADLHPGVVVQPSMWIVRGEIG